MPEAKVNIIETDISTRVVGDGEVYAGICIKTAKGPVEGATLVTSIDELYRMFVPGNTIGTGWDTAYESAKAFLASGKYLWVKRVLGADDSVGGVFFPSDIKNSVVGGVGPAKSAIDFAESYQTDTQVSSAVDASLNEFAIYSKDPGEWGDNISISIIPYCPSAECVSNNNSVITDNVVVGLSAFAWPDSAGAKVWGCGISGEVAGDNYSPIEFERVNVSVFRKSSVGDLTPLSAVVAREEAHGEFVVAQSGEILGNAWVKLTGESTYGLFTSPRGDSGERDRYTFAELYPFVSTYADLPTSGVADGDLMQIKTEETALNYPAGTVFVASVAGDVVTWNVLTKTPDVIVAVISPLDSEAATSEDGYTLLVKDASNGTILENWKVSNGQDIKDGFNAPLFVETVLASSNYVHAAVHVDNSANKPNASIRDFKLVNASGDPKESVDEGLYVSAANVFLSKEDYRLRILLDGGQTGVAYQKKLESIAKSRMDCVAVLSTPAEYEKSLDPKGAIVQYRKSVLNLNSSFAALFTPHLTILSEDSGQSISVAPDGYYGAALALAASQYEIWYPAAGLTRGVLSNVLDVGVKFNGGDRDYLVDNQINPIRFYPGSGIVIWGNKTLKSQASALQSLHIRMLLTEIEPAMASALESLLFDLNNDSTRTIARTICDSYLDNILARHGIDAKLVVCDDTNNTATDVDNGVLNITVPIVPTGSVETINLNIVVTSHSISVDTAANLV